MSNNIIIDVINAVTRNAEDMNTRDLTIIRTNIKKLLTTGSHDDSYTLNKGKPHEKIVEVKITGDKEYIYLGKTSKSQGATSSVTSFKILLSEVQLVAA